VQLKKKSFSSRRRSWISIPKSPVTERTSGRSRWYPELSQTRSDAEKYDATKY
jgi:hypothetical protein